MMRILVVDDEEDICEILKFNLEFAGYEVGVAFSSEEALLLDISSYHLILLDVMMGEMSGFSLASHLKKNKETANIPIIFVTAKDTENDMLTGFNLGADDYISKPFRVSEVIARVKAILRRVPPKVTEETGVNSLDKFLECDGLKINESRMVVTLSGNEIVLTKKEFDLLLFLMKNEGVFFSRDQIIQQVWSDDVSVLDRSVDVNVARLRKKMGAYSDYIVSRSGYGYSFKRPN